MVYTCIYYHRNDSFILFSRNFLEIFQLLLRMLKKKIIWNWDYGALRPDRLRGRNGNADNSTKPELSSFNIHLHSEIVENWTIVRVRVKFSLYYGYRYLKRFEIHFLELDSNQKSSLFVHHCQLKCQTRIELWPHYPGQEREHHIHWSISPKERLWFAPSSSFFDY